MMADSLFQTFIISVYQLVIISSGLALCFVYYLFRTRVPQKEKVDEGNSDSFPAEGIMSESSGDLLQAVADGIRMSDNVADSAEEEEEEENEEEEEEEEQESEDVKKNKRQIIREVTVRKLILPPESEFSDVQKIAAKNLIGRAIEKRKQGE